MSGTSSDAEKCDECGNSFGYCTCRFDFISNLPEFIAKRTKAIHKHRTNQIFVIKRVVLLLNHVMENLPMCYRTRSGCLVEEHPMQAHSEHDTSRIIAVLLITEFNELLVTLSSGSYSSALRTIRSMIEWLIRSIAAVSDRSIFCKSLQDQNRNRAVCFEGLKELLISNHLKKSSQKRFRRSTQNLEFPASDNWLRYYYFLRDSRVPNGVNEIPKKLNGRITANFELRNPKTQQIENGSEALYSIYHTLSQSIHDDLETFGKMQYGGATDFLDLEQFDKTYSVIVTGIDAVLYLYFILIDIDVHHSSKEDRKEGRAFLRQKFYESKFGKSTFHACTRLLTSRRWNDCNAEFADSRNDE